jgi:hypothetical protein
MRQAVIFAAALAVGAGVPETVVAQGRQGVVGGVEAPGEEPVRPAPRRESGQVRLDGGKEPGLWLGRPGDGFWDLGENAETVPYQDWTAALAEERRQNQLEPHARCKPSGLSRQFLTPYGAEIVEIPELQRIYIFDVGGPHSYRTIYMDGRTHPVDVSPSYYGHSIGWWDGDTLVVETTGFNEGFWMDRGGLPHTSQLRAVERFTRTEFGAMRYVLTIDDPGAYTDPFDTEMELRWAAGDELFEYVCQQANYAPELMVGESEGANRTSPIVP